MPEEYTPPALPKSNDSPTQLLDCRRNRSGTCQEQALEERTCLASLSKTERGQKPTNFKFGAKREKKQGRGLNFWLNDTYNKGNEA